MENINFDSLSKKEKKFTLSGEELKAPGSIPVKYMVKIMKLSNNLENGSAESLQEYTNTLYDILKKSNNIEQDWFEENITIDLAVALFNWIANDINPVDTIEDIKKRAQEISNQNTKKK